MPDLGEWSPASLQKLWNSLFRESLSVGSSPDPVEQSLALLIECTHELFRKHLNACETTRNELKSTQKELTRKREEISEINSELERLKLKCCNCALLEKELAEVKKEAREAQSRMDSIAKILRISEHLSQKDRNQTAYDLVSQYVGKALEGDVENELTRKKESPPNKKVEGLWRAIYDSEAIVEKRVLAQVDLPANSFGQEKQLTPEKGRVKFNINSSTEECQELLDDTIKEYIKSNEAELDRLWGSKKLSDEPVSIVNSTWNLKDARGPKEIDKASGKCIKQTKLGFKSQQKRLDVSKLNGFNGGIASQHKPKSTTDEVDIDEDDIILGSPIASSSCGIRSPNEDFITNTSSFKPVATSTQVETVEERDRSVKRKRFEHNNQYFYERGAVRKKEERARMDGWSCFECEQYYSSLGLTPDELKKRMNACSRHRNNHDPKLNETPEGFWNPVFPDTQERKRLYPAVFGGKESNRK